MITSEQPIPETGVGAGAGASASASASARNGLSPDADTRIHIIGGSPTPGEVAVVTAVLQASLAELAAAQALLDTEVTSAWQRSQGQLRAPLRNARGAWRSFSG